MREEPPADRAPPPGLSRPPATLTEEHSVLAEMPQVYRCSNWERVAVAVCELVKSVHEAQAAVRVNLFQASHSCWGLLVGKPRQFWQRHTPQDLEFIACPVSLCAGPD